MRFAVPFLSFYAAAVCLVSCVILTASADDKATPDPTPDSDSSTESNMLRDIPLDETFQGLRIPHSGPDGKLIMLLDTKVAKRVDEDHVEMADLRIEFTDDDKTFIVTMPTAVFNLSTRILSTDESVRIEREDFVLDGDAAEFDTRNRLGRVTGNIKMLILDTDNLENE